MIKALIAAGADVNQASFDGTTPLYKALQNGHLEVVKILIAAGAHFDQRLIEAAQQLGHSTIVKHLTKVKLTEYINKRNTEPEYKKKITLFGHDVNFDYSKKQKVGAAQVLLQLLSEDSLNGGSAKNFKEEARLREHLGTLGGGELSSIAKHVL